LRYSLIVTAVAIVTTGAAALIWKQSRKRIAEISQDLNDAIAANYSLWKELERREHIIRRQQEVQNEAEEQKREVRKHANPGDRANAASDLMSELSRGGDGD